MIACSLTKDQILSGFKITEVTPIPELRSIAIIASHIKTGARMVHLYNEDPNNLFTIGFRTPVSDSTGVPHILEHSVLCGSERYPIKDPFQELLKGSLQTFLNALTYPDKTVYPVSSQVEKDFNNLMSIYCDAVFFPLLTRNTFLQEGWHFDAPDANGEIGIKGIVYNEMKGVFSDFQSHASRNTMQALFPDTTYFHESGGEPEHITDLTYEAFKDFHARYYHPTNSFIFLYGNVPSEKTFERLDKEYLSRFSARPIDSEIKKQPLFKQETRLDVTAPSSPEDDGTATVTLNFICGNTTDPINVLTGSILSRYLLGSEHAPLKRALIDSGLGEDLDASCGFDAELIQTTFCAGLRKTKPEHAETIRSIILDTLKDQVEKGFDLPLLLGAIKRTEFRLREITSGHFPYNLGLAERCFRSWLYDGHPLNHLAFDKPMSFIAASDPECFFKNAIKEFFLDNTHRLLATIRASKELGEALEPQTRLQAEKLTASFTSADKQNAHKVTNTLLTEQKKLNDPALLATLPTLSRADLPLKNRIIPVSHDTLETVPVYSHPIFTSGITYVDIGFDFNGIDPSLIPYLPLFSELLTRCGANTSTSAEMARRISLSTGGISCSFVCDTNIHAPEETLLRLFIHGKALDSKTDDLATILSDIIVKPDLGDTRQIKELVFELRNDLNASILYNGHSFATLRASASLSALSTINEQLEGISHLRFLSNLLESDSMDLVAENLALLHAWLIQKEAAVISITAQTPSAHLDALKKLAHSLPESNRFKHDKPYETLALAHPAGIEINSSVNFVAQVFKISHVSAQQAAGLFLLCRNLSAGYLWDKVRVEGGAYGGRASFSLQEPIFSCSSYRDPNITSTLGHFTKALKSILTDLTEETLEQSIIGTIGKFDAPQTPHGQGLSETLALLAGRTVSFRQKIRDAVLDATASDIGLIATQILGTKENAIVILGSKGAFDGLEKEHGFFASREGLSNAHDD